MKDSLCAMSGSGVSSQANDRLRDSSALHPTAGSQRQVVYPAGGKPVRAFNVVVERDPDTGLCVGYVPG